MRVILPLESSYNKMNMTNLTVLVIRIGILVSEKKVILYINNEMFVRILLFNKTELSNYPWSYTSWHSDTCRNGDNRTEHS